MAHDVFISHSSKDKTTAEAVCTTLETNGIRCWVAPRDILPGHSWGTAIAQAISQSRAMVLIFSSNANKSEHIAREVERATSKGVPIIPFRIEDVTPSNSLEYFLSTLHWLDALTPPLANHSQRLAHNIHSLLGMSPEQIGEEESDDSGLSKDKAEDRTTQDVAERAWWAYLTSAPNKVERKRMLRHAIVGGLIGIVIGTVSIMAIKIYTLSIHERCYECDDVTAIARIIFLFAMYSAGLSIVFIPAIMAFIKYLRKG